MRLATQRVAHLSSSAALALYADALVGARPISSCMIHFQVVMSIPSPIIADLFG
jgi:hypothetical protein